MTKLGLSLLLPSTPKSSIWSTKETLESPLDCKEIQPVHPKGDQSWIFIGRTYAGGEAPILWLPDVKNWFIGKGHDTGKDWRQEEKGTTEDEMVAWHHSLSGREFGVGDGQGDLACCGSWGCKESDMTKRLNWTNICWTGCEKKVNPSHTTCGNVNWHNQYGKQYCVV